MTGIMVISTEATVISTEAERSLFSLSRAQDFSVPWLRHCSRNDGDSGHLDRSYRHLDRSGEISLLATLYLKRKKVRPRRHSLVVNRFFKITPKLVVVSACQTKLL
jgi:hypothetical protein